MIEKAIYLNDNFDIEEQKENATKIIFKVPFEQFENTYEGRIAGWEETQNFIDEFCISLNYEPVEHRWTNNTSSDDGVYMLYLGFRSRRCEGSTVSIVTQYHKENLIGMEVYKDFIKSNFK